LLQRKWDAEMHDRRYALSQSSHSLPFFETAYCVENRPKVPLTARIL
jgi:hypothetical protein